MNMNQLYFHLPLITKHYLTIVVLFKVIENYLPNGFIKDETNPFLLFIISWFEIELELGYLFIIKTALAYYAFSQLERNAIHNLKYAEFLMELVYIFYSLIFMNIVFWYFDLLYMQCIGWQISYSILFIYSMNESTLFTVNAYSFSYKYIPFILIPFDLLMSSTGKNIVYGLGIGITVHYLNKLNLSKPAIAYTIATKILRRYKKNKGVIIFRRPLAMND